ncbi:MAG: hypothetical protein ACFFD9_10145 [Candidatus Thorarchaeota archaeon]
MPGKKRTAISLITIIVFVSGIGVVGLPMWHALHFRWGVEEGAQFTYDVRVVGYKMYGTGNGSYYYEPPPYACFNNSVITVNITFLPGIPVLLTPDIYAEQIINTDKVTVVPSSNMIENETETEIVERYRILSEPISRCLTPVGGWTILDSFYPNELELWISNTYLSRLESNEFVLGHHHYFYDSGDGWYGNISLETVIPVSATLWENKMYGSPWIDYSITLTLR